jgi:hypothetical protein
MKKSKLFIGAGALLLVATSIFATKTAKKFTTPSIYTHTTGVYQVFIPASCGTSPFESSALPGSATWHGTPVYVDVLGTFQQAAPAF